jgi:hypothetical protein
MGGNFLNPTRRRLFALLGSLAAMVGLRKFTSDVGIAPIEAKSWSRLEYLPQDEDDAYWERWKINHPDASIADVVMGPANCGRTNDA